MSAAPLIYLIAGEPSGDLLGGRLMAALKAETGDAVRFAGVGGERMAEEGLRSLIPMHELAVMGFIEVLPHARRILARIKETVADIAAHRPDIVVTIDSSGFTWRVARRLRAAGSRVTLIHMVAPMVWAWRPHRAREIARWYDRLLALLPFEPPYFEKVGLACTFVGHPVIESGADRGDGPGFRARHHIAPERPVLTVLPGSRRGEVERLLPIFGAAVALLAPSHPTLRIVIPTLGHVAGLVRTLTANWPIAPIIVAGEVEKFAAFAASDLALAASGTVALELAVARLPAVIAYRIHPLTHAVARHMIKIRYANLVNLLLDRFAIPELIQYDCNAARIADALTRLIGDKAARTAQLAAYDVALDLLGRGGEPPSRRAAKQILAARSS
ncbi:MAG TPA: lipid-A-disaccharide synthase [Stellaceae bacterium]